MSFSRNNENWQEKGFGWIPDLPDIADPDLSLALNNKTHIVSHENTEALEYLSEKLGSIFQVNNLKGNSFLEDIDRYLLGDTRFPKIKLYKILRKNTTCKSHEMTLGELPQAKEVVQLRQALYWLYEDNKDKKYIDEVDQRKQDKPLSADFDQQFQENCSESLIDILKKHDKGSSQRLKWLQNPIFDEGLELTVKDFQSRNNLVKDGIVGLRTYTKLRLELAKYINPDAASSQDLQVSNVQLLCPSSIIPHEILAEVFQHLTYVWLYEKFRLAIHSLCQSAVLAENAPALNKIIGLIETELVVAIGNNLKDVSRDFREYLQGEVEGVLISDISTSSRIRLKGDKWNEDKIFESRRAASSLLKNRLDKVKDELFELAGFLVQEKSGETSKESLLRWSEKIRDKIQAEVSDYESTWQEIFICRSNDEFIHQFNLWFHVIEPFISGLFQLLSPLANFDNYKQAIQAGFDRLDSCFRLYDLESSPESSSYKKLFLEYAQGRASEQIKELQEYRKTIVLLFQEALVKIDRVRQENLIPRIDAIQILEDKIKADQIVKITSEQQCKTFEEFWVQQGRAEIETHVIRHLDEIEQQFNELNRKGGDDSSHTEIANSLRLDFVAAKRRAWLEQDFWEKGEWDKVEEVKLSDMLLSDLNKERRDLEVCLQFFKFIEEIISLKYGKSIRLARPISSKSNDRVELTSFLASKKELFEIQCCESNIDLKPIDRMPLSRQINRDLFLEPTILQLPVSASLLSHAPRANEPPTQNSSDGQNNLPKNITQSYFFLPGFVDLSYWCSPVEDQGTVNACTAFAGVSLLEYFSQKRYGKYTSLSARFLYKAARNLMNRLDDSGTSVRQTMKALALFGVPPEEIWPWRSEGVHEEPPAFCYAYAQSYQALKSFRLDAAHSRSKTTTVASRDLLLFQIKAVLAAGLPCMFGFTVYDSYYKDRNIRLGHIPYPSSRDQVVGGHAAVAVGYNDYKVIDRIDGEAAQPGALLIRNSWGPNWGNGGYGWMPYEYVLEGLTADWWSLLKSEWFDGGAFGLGAFDSGTSREPDPTE